PVRRIVSSVPTRRSSDLDVLFSRDTDQGQSRRAYVALENFVAGALKSQQLFRRVPLRCCLRLGRFVGRLVAGLRPLGMKNSRFIDAFVGVGTEESALCLQQ